MEPTSSAYGERRRSFGRGGAGNIRSHAEALTDMPTEVGQQRRRSSIWSTSSSSEGDGTSRRSKIFQNVKNMFTSKSSTEEIPEEKA